MGRPPRITREQVLAQARQAFAERGFHGTTLAHIGSRLGVSPAALLRYAHSKEELFSLALEAEPEAEALPSDFLSSVPPSEDPEQVLRRLAHLLVPFIERKIGENIARFLRTRSEEQARTIRLPFDPRKKGSPPARVVGALEEYFRRARAAHRISLRDPRAGALAFVGSLQAYIFFHRILRLEPPIPFEHYLDAVIDIWKRGPLRLEKKPRAKRAPRKERVDR